MESGWKYLDVRTTEEVESLGAPPNAINVPWKNKGPGGMTDNPEFMDKVKALLPDND